ncbi:hypothetical protein [Nocardia transvalensis]|uniref:hypothetical protein n=1 Tax=Nocardia transvalensis TaxID=37333 RepID=UPI0018960E9F|nr:hypothetical protein [Nocardia transvalensis]MBF6333475.1 hypothetical protein [Nocardia transvalensis]
MFRRYSLRPIFTYNARMRSPEGMSLTWFERGLLYGVPAAVLVLVSTLRRRLSDPGQLLPAVVLLAVAMIGVVLALIQLRLHIQDSGSYSSRVWIKELVSATAASALKISVLLLAMGVVLGAMMTWPWLAGGQPGALASGVFLALLAHGGLETASLLRRLCAVYVDLFYEDFMTKPESER